MQSEKPDFLRTISMDSSKQLPPTLHPTNEFSDPHYTWLRIIPYNLFEQFHRSSNIWFLIVSIFELLPYELNPGTSWDTISLLSFLVLVSLFQDLYNCYKFKSKTKDLNENVYSVWSGQGFTEIQSRYLSEGMIIQLSCNQIVPADTLLLARQDSSDSVFLDITSLVGCFSLLAKQPLDALERTMKSQDSENKDLSALKGEISLGEPTADYSDFSGMLRLSYSPKALKLSIKNLLVSGGLVKGSKSIIGIILYCGADTKLRLNSPQRRHKLSRIEKKVNHWIFFVLVRILAFVLVSLIGYYINGNTGMNFIEVVIYFALIYSNMIPISMFVAVELVRLIQNYKYMHKHPDVVFVNDKVNEDFGQVEYLLTDISETFTKGEKRMSYCVVGGKVFVNYDKNDEAVSGLGSEDENHFENLDLLLSDESTYTISDQFVRSICLCNNLIQSNEDLCGLPEEIALLGAGNNLGYTILFEDKESINLCDQKSDKLYRKVFFKLQTPKRDRVSVLIEDCFDGCGYLYVKASSKSILSIIALEENEKSSVVDNLALIDAQNAVPWIFAYKKIPEEKMKTIQARILRTKKSLLSLDRKIDQILNEEEKELTLLGIAGITEKLQHNSSETFKLLQSAGIKIWLTSSDSFSNTITAANKVGLTADMPEVTIRNMKNDNLLLELLDRKINDFVFLKPRHSIFQRGGTKNLSAPVQLGDKNDVEEEEYVYRDNLTSKLMIKNQSRVNCDFQSTLKTQLEAKVPPFYVVIDQQSLNTALGREECRKMLVCLLVSAKFVCFVGLMPAGKAEVVRLLKRNLAKPPCIAVIGSGDSDFAMVQAADVSIGIRKTQDFLVFHYIDVTISKFSQLAHLFLINGHYNYHRIAKVVMLFLYKNSVLTIVQFGFTIYTGFSGTTAYSLSYLIGFNLFFTVFPIIYIGIFDRDVPKKYLKKKPSIYLKGICNEYFTYRSLLLSFGFTIIQSVILIMMLYQVMPLVMFNNGFTENIDVTSAYVCITLVVTINMKFFVESYIYSLSFLASLLSSAVAMVIFIIILGRTGFAVSDFVGVDQMIICSPFALFAIFVTSLVAIIPTLAFRLYKRVFLSEILNYSAAVNFSISLRFGSSNSTLGSMYKASKTTAPVIATNKITTNRFSLKLIPDYMNEKYTRRAIKTHLGEFKIKSIILITCSVIWLVVSIGISNNNINYIILQIFLTCTSLILLIILHSPKIIHLHRRLILVYLALITLGKLALDVTKTDARILMNVIIASLSFLELNVHWLGIICINILNIGQSILAVSLTPSASSSNVYTIQSLHEMVLLVSITVCTGIQGYFKEAFLRSEFILVKKIKSEYFRSLFLLDILFPAFIKNKLKTGGRYIAENQGEVTIIFCDICGFDEICATYKPLDLITFLDKLFTSIDKLCDNYGVVKIETVGKTYMACAGLNDYDKNLSASLKRIPHAKRALEFSFAILEEVSNIKLQNEESLKVKIGINSGTVTAGVVGYHKPQFSLVGDTVNTASRMCSTLTQSNSIQISTNTYDLVYGFSDYHFTKGQVEAKGKGLIDMYIVTETIKNEAYKTKYDVDASSRQSTHFNMTLEITSPAMTGGGFSYSNNTVKHENNRRSSWLRIENKSHIQRIKTNINTISKASRASSFSKKEFLAKRRGKKYKMSSNILLIVLTTYLILFLLILLETFVSNTVDSVWLIAIRGAACGYLLLLYVFYNFRLTFMLFDLLVIPCVALMYLIPLGFIFQHYDIPAGIVCAEIILAEIVLCHNSNIPIIPFTSIITILAIIWIVLASLFSSTLDHIFYFFVFIIFNSLYIHSRFAHELAERTLFNLKAAAQKETEENKALLKNLMPKHVFKSLGNESTFTDRLQNVTILYADIVGFTKWSSDKTPVKIVEMLSKLFSNFDKLCVEMDVYKVYTIGDCYVIMGFKKTKERNYEDECVSVLKTAFKMIGVIKKKDEKHGLGINMRIGIHTGEVIGAVVGTSIVRYDIWGSDVLIANKMESNGEAGRVKVSEDTMNLLSRTVESGIEFEDSRDVEIKNLGTVKKTFWVNCPNINKIIQRYNSNEHSLI